MDKDQLAKLLSVFNEDVLKVAIMYATNYLKYGVDVTEKLDTAVRQQNALHKARCEGYYDGRSSIIRCKDCKHCFTEGFVNERNVCEKHPEIINPADDWFCADGVRDE